MNLQTLLNSNEYVFLDGAMGTMLYKAGLKLGDRPEVFNITHGEIIKDIHFKYIKAGSNIVYTNTFGANRKKIEKTPYTVQEIISAGVKNAKLAIKDSGRKDVFVALDIGPIGELLEPNGTLSFDEAVDIFKEQMIAGEKEGADLIVVETMTDLYELKAAILAAKENTSLPIFTTMTFEKNQRTFTGCSVESFIATVSGLGVNALGLNCSLGPDEIYPIAEKISKISTIPIIVKANAGLPNLETNEYDVDEFAYGNSVEKIAKLGVKFIGGCCGTTPDYIKVLSDLIKKIEKRDLVGITKINEKESLVCTATKYVNVNELKVVGERINPTGKKRFQKALADEDMDYILGQVIEQVDAGADILDVNVGSPGIDEPKLMKKVVKSIMSVTDIPLQIDSSNKEALEVGLRYYNGKAIVNSVNGEQAVMDRVFPLVKKYGAAVVALTLDENGIPEEAEDRVKIAQKIISESKKYEISPKDIYVDCLTLTVSAKQEGARQTLKAIREVKKLGVKTILGVSNISFGLPNRELINTTFLTMAMEAGLDLAIMNPNSKAMMDAVYAFKVLNCNDIDSETYVNRFNGFTKSTDININTKEDLTIENAVIKGLKEETKAITKEMLKEKEEMEIINCHLIPALDIVGDKYEKGEIFLPQLIKSAMASQEAFEVIKTKIASKGGSDVAKGKIVMATVKGDIHDIGKNIVKVILENYGYEVIDLGKDVEIDLVANTVKEKNIKLVGLSALMTTTLKSMEDTIAKIREVTNDCKIMVGGAVLTEDYAMKIGADYYCKDAKTSVECAKIVFKDNN